VISTNRGLTQKSVQIIVVLILAVITIGPIFWGASTSFKKPNEIIDLPPRIIGSAVTLEHYQKLIQSQIQLYFRNSMLYSVCAVILALMVGSLAAYIFSRFQFSLKKPLFFLVVAGIPMAIARASVLIPTYVYLSKLQLVDRWFTLIILYTAYNLPMAIWILIGSFETIPRQLDEAAMIDGSSRMYILFRIILPLARPGLAAAGLFIFLGAWNDFIVASMMISSTSLKSIQLAIYHYLGFWGREWGPLTASSIVAIVPILVLFAFLQKNFIAGLTRGSVKG